MEAVPTCGRSTSSGDLDVRELACPLPIVTDEDLERELERRLAESSRLAFRVAYGVLRHQQDAEDVAQEAFAKA